MIDFIDGYYTTRDPKTSDGYDREGTANGSRSGA